MLIEDLPTLKLFVPLCLEWFQWSELGKIDCAMSHHKGRREVFLHQLERVLYFNSTVGPHILVLPRVKTLSSSFIIWFELRGSKARFRTIDLINKHRSFRRIRHFESELSVNLMVPMYALLLATSDVLTVQLYSYFNLVHFLTLAAENTITVLDVKLMHARYDFEKEANMNVTSQPFLNLIARNYAHLNSISYRSCDFRCGLGTTVVDHLMLCQNLIKCELNTLYQVRIADFLRIVTTCMTITTLRMSSLGANTEMLAYVTGGEKNMLMAVAIFLPWSETDQLALFRWSTNIGELIVGIALTAPVVDTIITRHLGTLVDLVLVHRGAEGLVKFMERCPCLRNVRCETHLHSDVRRTVPAKFHPLIANNGPEFVVEKMVLLEECAGMSVKTIISIVKRNPHMKDIVLRMSYWSADERCELEAMARAYQIRLRFIHDVSCYYQSFTPMFHAAFPMRGKILM
jgi:hypothetical protein